MKKRENNNISMNFKSKKIEFCVLFLFRKRKKKIKN